VVKSDILEAAGCSQLCAGQRGGCEAAIHAMREIYMNTNTEGVLLVDASNAFNSLNRRAALLNIIYYYYYQTLQYIFECNSITTMENYTE